MKKVFSLFLCFVLLLSCMGCVKRASDYTEAEHIQRITERVEKRFETTNLWDGEKFESFEVYPLYNENEELTHFLVEFEPYGFMFISLFEEKLSAIYMGYSPGMYLTDLRLTAWSPYIPVETENGDQPKDYEYILNENGGRIYYKSSPFKVKGKLNEKKYMLKASATSYIFVCAVKRGDKYINLMNDVEVDVANGDLNKLQAVFWVNRIPKKQAAL